MSLFFIFFCKSSFRGLSSCRLQGTRGPWALLQGFPAIERGANRPQQLWKPYARGVYGADVTAGCHVSKPKKKKSQLVSDVVVDLPPCRVLRVPAGNRIHQLRVVKQQAPLPRERPMQLPHAYVKPRSQDKKGGDYCKTVCPVRHSRSCRFVPALFARVSSTDHFIFLLRLTHASWTLYCRFSAGA